MTPRLRSNRAVHGIGVDDCEMRERLAPHRDCVQCRMVEDAVLDAIDELERKVEILSGGVTGEMVMENKCLRGYLAMLFQLIDANSKSWGHAEIAAVDRVRAAFESLAGRSE